MAKGSFQVFKGPILDHTGRTVVPAGQSMTDEQILGMKFMVQGVR
jgi:simple sugar transport system substrate-binding protein